MGLPDRIRRPGPLTNKEFEMKIKTAVLIGPALDWAVRYAETGRRPIDYVANRDNYSTCWNKGGPIIERERFYLQPGPLWYAMRSDVSQPMLTRHSGPTALIAAMRCFVASRLGDEVDVPEELTWKG